jgi:hypothetical protein
MNTPTHDEIARQAYELWQNRGCPDGCDAEIWLEAERQLRGDGRAAFVARVAGETAAESVVEFNISPAVPQQEAIQAALQKQDARAPQVPHHTGPKGKPAPTGKPLWTGPHSR